MRLFTTIASVEALPETGLPVLYKQTRPQGNPVILQGFRFSTIKRDRRVTLRSRYRRMI